MGLLARGDEGIAFTAKAIAEMRVGSEGDDGTAGAGSFICAPPGGGGGGLPDAMRIQTGCGLVRTSGPAYSAPGESTTVVGPFSFERKSNGRFAVGNTWTHGHDRQCANRGSSVNVSSDSDEWPLSLAMPVNAALVRSFGSGEESAVGPATFIAAATSGAGTAGGGATFAGEGARCPDFAAVVGRFSATWRGSAGGAGGRRCI